MTQTETDYSQAVVASTCRVLVNALASKGTPVVCQAVDDAIALKVTPAPDDRGLFLSLSHPFRTILVALGKACGYSRVTYVVDVPPDAPPRIHRPIPRQSTWNKCRSEELLEAVLGSLFKTPPVVTWKERPDKSTMLVEIGPGEASHVPDVELELALSRVLGAHARARGRKLYLELRRTENSQ